MSSYQKTIMELAELMPQMESFSAILLAGESFREMCKISCCGSAQDWFTKVITLSPAEEQVFDDICREINAELVLCYGAMMEKRTNKKPISLYQKILEFLQGSSIEIIMERCQLPALRCRLGMVVLAQALGRKLIADIRSCIQVVQEARPDSPLLQSHMKNVNRLFGWAIFSVHAE
jgi:hypothetical protein